MRDSSLVGAPILRLLPLSVIPLLRGTATASAPRAVSGPRGVDIASAAAGHSDGDQQTHAISTSCVDDPTFTSMFGLSCSQHKSLVCDGFRGLGFNDADVDELLQRCPASCRVSHCVGGNSNGYDIGSTTSSIGSIEQRQERIRRRMTATGNSINPAMTLERLEDDDKYNADVIFGLQRRAADGACFAGWEDTCQDDPTFFSALSLPCASHKTFDCRMTGVIGFSEEETFQLINNCPCSCRIKCGTVTRDPTSSPTPAPTVSQPPSAAPSATPSASPTSMPSSSPSASPTHQPSVSPSYRPSSSPTISLSAHPSQHPSQAPTPKPSASPTTSSPSATPSALPTVSPTSFPTYVPTHAPTSGPTPQHSDSPSQQPSAAPTFSSSSHPSASLTSSPSARPSTSPSASPSAFPTSYPTRQPTDGPTVHPTDFPSSMPSVSPFTLSPTKLWSQSPSNEPSASPSDLPSALPSIHPSAAPTPIPSAAPSASMQPSPSPSSSFKPSASPSVSMQPTLSLEPSIAPTFVTSEPPTFITSEPTLKPTNRIDEDKWSALVKSTIGNKDDNEGKSNQPFLSMFHIILIAAVGGGIILLTALYCVVSRVVKRRRQRREESPRILFMRSKTFANNFNSNNNEGDEEESYGISREEPHEVGGIPEIRNMYSDCRDDLNNNGVACSGVGAGCTKNNGGWVQNLLCTAPQGSMRRGDNSITHRVAM